VRIVKWSFSESLGNDPGTTTIIARSEVARGPSGAEFIAQSVDVDWLSPTIPLVNGASVVVPQKVGRIKITVYDYFGRPYKPAGILTRLTEEISLNPKRRKSRPSYLVGMGVLLLVTAFYLYPRFIPQKATTAPTSQNTTNTKNYMYVSAIEANVRKAPNLSSPSISKIHRGYKVSMMGSSEDNLFTQIDWNGQVNGWMSNNVLLNQEDWIRLEKLSASEYLSQAATLQRFQQCLELLTAIETEFNRLARTIGERSADSRTIVESLSVKSLEIIGDTPANRWFYHGRAEPRIQPSEVFSRLFAATSASPFRTDSLNGLGEISVELNKLNEVLFVAKMMFLSAPKNAATWRYIGLARSISNGDTASEKEAVAAFIMAIRLATKPNNERTTLIQLMKKYPNSKIANLIQTALDEEKANPLLFQISQ
jgi:hypothetical protein